MRLQHVVVTMVARDDLPDGGAGMVAETIRQIRLENPGTSIEVLISDLNGRRDGHPHGGRGPARHPQPQRRDRPAPAAGGAPPSRSGIGRVSVLTQGRAVATEIGFDEMVTKTGIMLGLGETLGRDRRGHAPAARGRCRGAHDRPVPAPSRQHLPLVKYYTPAEFMALRRIGLEMGFKHVQSGPLVRSSYHAAEQVPGRETAAAV